MEPYDLLKIVVRELNDLGIEYVVTGSIASMTHGESRLTIDIDIVVWLSASNAVRLCQRFPAPEFYCSETAALEAVKLKRQFNIIHSESGFKIDLMIAADDEVSRQRSNRKQRITLDDEFSAWFLSPEDIIIAKLQYYKLGESEKHVRDILSVLKIQKNKVDREYIEHWCLKLDILQEWNEILTREAESKK